MIFIQEIKKKIKYFIPHGIVEQRKQRWQKVQDEILLQQRIRENKIKEYFLSLANIDDPEILEIINYFKKYDKLIWWFPYFFSREYFPMDVDVYFCSVTKARYVIHENKKLYFPKSWESDVIRCYYNNLRREQDKDSPHRYETGAITVKEGDVIVDVGAAEGIWALTHAEKAKKIYLFESSREWVEALEKTFAPWKEKIIISNKYISDIDDRINTTRDTYFNSAEEINFIKIDIEGMELKLINGSKNILSRNNNLKVVLCAYHGDNDAIDLKQALEKNGYETEYSKGYMICSYDENLKEPYIRRGIVRARKNIWQAKD